MVALRATEELRRGFISTPCLYLPDVDNHVPAFGAFHPHCRHSIDVVFFADNCNLLLQSVLYDFTTCFCFSFLFGVGLNITTLIASEAYAVFGLFWHETRTAVWTKLHRERLPRICENIENDA